MSHRSKFQAGHGIYNCSVCRRRTRGDGDSHTLDLCGQCHELLGQDNHYNDNGLKPDAADMNTFNSLLAEIVAKGGDGDYVKRYCTYIWTDESPELHRRSITSDELTRSEALIAKFENDLNDLIRDASRECDEIGGYFRSPGMKAEIRQLLEAASI